MLDVFLQKEHTENMIAKKRVYLESSSSTDKVWAISGESPCISFFVRYLFTSFDHFSIGSIHFF